MTGVGAVLNTAEIKAGSSAAVIGCGGVGLSALLGCVLAGCYPLIAVDIVPSKLEFARELGATHTINSREEDAVKALRKLTRIGPDYAFDSVGAAVTMNQALNSVRAGGSAVVMGMHALKEEVPISAGALIGQNKRLLGSFAFITSAGRSSQVGRALSRWLAARGQVDYPSLYVGAGQPGLCRPGGG
jgi:alcohol dehydrogenase